MGGTQPAESHSLRGAIDRPALIAIRDLITDVEPLASAQLDDVLNPSVLEIELNDGLLDADAARIDVQWTTQNDYKYHYTDSLDVNLRWGRHHTMAISSMFPALNTIIHRRTHRPTQTRLRNRASSSPQRYSLPGLSSNSGGRPTTTSLASPSMRVATRRELPGLLSGDRRFLEAGAISTTVLETQTLGESRPQRIQSSAGIILRAVPALVSATYVLTHLTWCFSHGQVQTYNGQECSRTHSGLSVVTPH